MPLPVRPLPVVQNWDCHSCTNCCREYLVPVADEERRRILAQGWERDPQIGGAELFARDGPWWSRQYVLRHRDGACIFLSAQGRCRIHERFGAEAKPFACQLYPFVLLPAGDHWRVGLRFACPSVAASKGRPLAEHRSEIDRYAAALAKREGMDETPSPAPPLQAGQRVEWPDLLRFVSILLTLLGDRRDRVHRRLRKCLALKRLCRQARFDQLTGKRLTEFLQVVSAGLETEVPADPAALPPPSWVGRVLFRPVLGLYARQDRGLDRGLAARGRLALLWAGWRFTVGKGTVPRVHGRLPETTFERLEEPLGPLPDDAEQVLERYYTMKVGSLQFCGAGNFHFPFWEGLEALALTFPAILWQTRAFAELPRATAVERAVGIVDHHFGYNRQLRGPHQRLALRILARRGELEKLIGWYSR
jgi:lysine-N-methylase